MLRRCRFCCSLSPYSIGLIYLFLASLCWIVASLLVQFLYENNTSKIRNDHLPEPTRSKDVVVVEDQASLISPFLVTYVGTSLFVILLPLEWVQVSSRRRRSSRSSHSVKNQQPNEQEDDEQDNNVDKERDIPTLLSYWDTNTKTYMIASIKVAPVYFIATYCLNASLKYTSSITSTTVLSSCCGPLFAFLLAVFCTKDEPSTQTKILGVLFGMIGSILMGFHDAHTSSDDNDSSGGNAIKEGTMTTNDSHVWADILALCSALGYGLYTVSLREIVPSELKPPASLDEKNDLNLQILLGSAGLWNMVLGSPIAIYQVWRMAVSTAIKHSNDSPDANTNLWFVFGSLIVKGLIDNVLGDFLYAQAVVLTSATVASVGAGLQIPLAILCDCLFFEGRASSVLDPLSIGSCISILLSFVLVNLHGEEGKKDKLVSEDGVPEDGDRHQERAYGTDVEAQRDENETDRIRRRARIQTSLSTEG